MKTYLRRYFGLSLFGLGVAHLAHALGEPYFWARFFCIFLIAIGALMYVEEE